MNENGGIYSQLALLTAVLTTFLSIAVFSASEDRNRNRYLAGIMAVPAVIFWGRYLFYTGNSLIPYIPFAGFSIAWFQAPFYLRYLEKSLSVPVSYPFLKYILATLVIATISVHSLFLYCFPVFFDPESVLKQKGLIGSYTAVFLLFISLFNAFFFLKAVRILWHRIYNKNTPEMSSEHLTPHSGWLIMLGSFLLMNFLIYILSIALVAFGFIAEPQHLFEIAYNAGLVLFFLYYLFRKPSVLHAVPSNPGRPKYAKHALSEDDAIQYRSRLLNYMQIERPYLNEELNLKQLAEETGISQHHLSIIINRDLGRNFFNFLADYRVEEAKRLMADPDWQKENMLAICYAAGFQSRSAFNSAFKRVTGKSPTDYRKGL